MTDTEIKERTASKCLATQKPYLAYTQDMIDAQISFKRRELTIWNHMALLNEINT
jgi:hypothetical protein